MCRWTSGICLLLLLGCDAGRPAIRLGTFGGWPGFEPLYLARELGYLDAKQVRLVDYSSSSPMQNDFSQGVIEAATLTLDETVRLIARRPDLRVVLLLGESRGADAIIGQPAFHSMTMLRGRRVGVETSGVGAFLLSRGLSKAGMSPQDIQAVALRIDEQERAFAQGDVDAIATFEPLKSRLTASGAHVLFDSLEIPGEIMDVLVVRKDITAERPAEIRAIISAWFRALSHMRKHEAEARARAARRLGVTEAQADTIWRGVKMGDEALNRAVLERGSLQHAMESNARLLHKSGLLDAPANASTVIDLHLVQEVIEGGPR